MVKINSVEGKAVLDSRHQETIEVTLRSGEMSATASVPSGKSLGSHEAVSLPVRPSLEAIVRLTPRIITYDFNDFNQFDQFLLGADGTPNKQTLGANTTLALSIAFIRLWAKLNNLQLYQVIQQAAGNKQIGFPKLFFNLINGGLHAKQELEPLPFQEYLVIPQEDSPKESLIMIHEFIDGLKEVFRQKQLPLMMGDEGGFVVSGIDPELGLELLHDVLPKVVHLNRIRFGLDVAATSLWNQDLQTYAWRNAHWSTDDLIRKYLDLFGKYNLFSIEDPIQEEAWGDWTKLYNFLGAKSWVIGDDLTTTNTDRLTKAHQFNAVNAVIIKPNQIGTVSETITAVNLAKSYGWKVVVSHRSGETMDDFIADLAVGVAADGLKAGSPLQKERAIKYWRLVQIEQSLS